MRLNMGCGFNHLDGYKNCDIEPSCNPDIVMDMEKVPWPFEDNSACTLVFNHSLEHVGQLRETFLAIIKEIYRVARPDATIKINVPNPNHPDFLGDPTHVRAITPQMLVTFDQSVNEDWIRRGLPGTPMGKYLGVDFETTKFVDHQGVWYEIVLKARKKAVESVVIEEPKKTVTLCRLGGLGDVCMMLAAAGAVKKTVGWRVEVITGSPYVKLAQHCPHVDRVIGPDLVSNQAQREVINLGPAHFGQQPGHQIDNYLKAIGVVADDKDKCLDLTYRSWGYNLPVKKRVVLHPGITDPNRTWPLEHWNELAIMLIRAGYEVGVIGSKDSADGRSMFTLDDKEVIDMTRQSNDEDPLIGTLNAFNHSDLLVSADSGPIQLAGASDIAIVGIYSVVSGKQRLPFRRGKQGWNAIAVEPDCPYHPCYGHMREFPRENLGKFFAEWCPNYNLLPGIQKYGCMKSISPQQVFTACIELLEKK